MDHGAILERVRYRFRDSGPFTRRYIGSKLKRDPINAALLSLGDREPFGDVVDFGCGSGQLGIVLLEGGVARSVLGLDARSDHIGRARRAGSGLSFDARTQDLTELTNVPRSDTVLLIDVLYQLGTAAQYALLDQAAQAAGQRMLIRTPDPRHRLRSLVSRTLEILARPLWPTSGRRVNAQPIDGIAQRLMQRGFAVEMSSCWKGTPFANTLLIARRVATGSLPK